MARVKDALTSPAVQQESHRAKPVERPRMELMKSEPVREEPVSGGRATVKQIKTTEDDYLDIPAFLRRQAN
jgi:cell division protein FtsZ